VARVEFSSNGSTAPGYLAVPPSGSGIPVVVLQEWWGVDEHIRDVCDRFAAAGFVALAPDLLRRASGAAVVAKTLDFLRAHVA
jgi:dienelactone hydrolase